MNMLTNSIVLPVLEDSAFLVVAKQQTCISAHLIKSYCLRFL